MDEPGFEEGFSFAGLEGEPGGVFEGGELGEGVGVDEVGAGEAMFYFGGLFEVEVGGGGFHGGLGGGLPGGAGLAGDEGEGGVELGVVPGEGDGAVAGGGAFAHFLVGAGFSVGGLQEDVVVAAEVEEVFDGFDGFAAAVLSRIGPAYLSAGSVRVSVRRSLGNWDCLSAAIHQVGRKASICFSGRGRGCGRPSSNTSWRRRGSGRCGSGGWCRPGRIGCVWSGGRGGCR